MDVKSLSCGGFSVVCLFWVFLVCVVVFFFSFVKTFCGKQERSADHIFGLHSKTIPCKLM